MDIEAFRHYCLTRNIPLEETRKSINELEKFENFLIQQQKGKSLENITLDDVNAYINFLKENNLTSYDDFIALARFGRFIKNNTIYTTVVELLDGADVMQRLSNNIESLVGKVTHDIVFDGLELPPLGTSANEKAIFTQKIMGRINVYLDLETSKKALKGYLHYIPKEQFAEDRKNYLKARNIDIFLKEKREKFLTKLENYKNQGTLFFTQEITDSVIDYVHQTPTTESGIREGNKIIITKIPYNAKEYLREEDNNKKKYYYCHCPWVRESLKNQKASISPIFCNCSAGFYKQFWEAVLDQPVDVEVLETILQGNDKCKFAVHLPDNIVKGE